jgi:hypothetical protein
MHGGDKKLSLDRAFMTAPYAPSDVQLRRQRCWRRRGKRVVVRNRATDAYHGPLRARITAPSAGSA